MKKALFFTLVLLLLSACVLPAFAAVPTVKVIDNANWLTDGEEAQLKAAGIPLESAGIDRMEALWQEAKRRPEA